MNRLTIDPSFDRKIIPFTPRRTPRLISRISEKSPAQTEEQIFLKAIAAPPVPFGFFSSLMTAKKLRPL